MKFTVNITVDWSDRGTADGGSPDSRVSGNRSPAHQIQTQLGMSVTDNNKTNSPVFTTYYCQAQARLRHSGSVRLKLRLSQAQSGSVTQAQ